jgi:hypothetical protein
MALRLRYEAQPGNACDYLRPYVACGPATRSRRERSEPGRIVFAVIFFFSERASRFQ